MTTLIGRYSRHVSVVDWRVQGQHDLWRGSYSRQEGTVKGGVKRQKSLDRHLQQA